jgi:hypothetical protein
MSTNVTAGATGRTAVERATSAEREQRLVHVADCLLEGKPRREILEHLMAQYQLSRRMAQKDVLEAQKRLATESADEEQLFYLRLGQQQRDELLAAVLNFVRGAGNADPQVVVNVTKLVATAARLLDGRSAAAVQIHKLVGGPHPAMAAAIREMHEYLQRGSADLDLSDPELPPEPSPRPRSKRKAKQEEDERILAWAAAHAPKETDEEKMARGMIPWSLVLRSREEGPDGPDGPAHKLCQQILKREYRPYQPPTSPSRPRDELERRFLQGRETQELPAIVPPNPKSRPGKEKELPAGVIDH